MRRIAITFVVLASFPLCSRAQESAAFLKIGVGARPLGMGGAYTAIADDVTAMAWNPAGLSGLAKRELGAMHAELVADTRYDFIGYAHPTKYGTFGAGAVYLTQAPLEGRDETGRPTGGFGASDSAINLSYGAKPFRGLRLGGNVKYIQSSIADASARSFAVDLGSQYELGRRGPGIPGFGFAIQNLGPRMRFLDESSPLPLTLATGIGYRLPAGLILAVDYKHRPYGHNSEVSVGTEYAILSGFALRAGYASAKALNNGSGGISALTGFATGFGLKALGYSLDYSITPFGELGNVQRISLGARF